MKRIIITIALALVAASSFAQQPAQQKQLKVEGNIMVWNAVLKTLDSTMEIVDKTHMDSQDSKFIIGGLSSMYQYMMAQLKPQIAPDTTKKKK